MPTGDRPSVLGALRGALFHYLRFLGNGRRALREVSAALAATGDERVLDVGCGSGGFCLVVPGEYVGIDLVPDYIAFARWRWRSPRRTFATTDLAALGSAPAFDKAILVNALHHMSDAEADSVLSTLARIVRRRLVVVDADPEASNWLQRFLLAHDRGDFIRVTAAQRDLVTRHFDLVGEGRFRNTPRTLVQTLFVCTPRQEGRGRKSEG